MLTNWTWDVVCACVCADYLPKESRTPGGWVAVVQEWEGDTLGLLGHYVSGTVLNTEDTSVGKTDTIYTPLYCLNVSMYIFPYQNESNLFFF